MERWREIGSIGADGDGEIERLRDVCGSSRWGRDRALTLERRWKAKVRESETYGRATLDLMSQCQQRFNQSKYLRQWTYLALRLVALFPALAVVVVVHGRVVRHRYHMSAHSPRLRFDSMDRAAGSSACRGVGKGRGVGYSLVVVVAVVVVGFL